MGKGSKLTAAALAAVMAMSLASVTAFADSIKTVDGVKYRYSDIGEQKGRFTGWARTKNGRYYYKNGVMMKSRWLTVGGKRTYYLRSSGKMAVGDVRFSDGRMYHFDDSGKLVYGIQLTVDNVTPRGLREHLKGLVLNDSSLHIYSTYKFSVEKRGDDGSWTELSYLDPDDLIDWPDALADYFHGDEESDFSENQTWTGMYGKLPAGEYRYVKTYNVSSGGKRAGSGKLYAQFTVPEVPAITEADLQAVRDHLIEHKEEYGIGEVYIDHENNYVVCEIIDVLKGYPFSSYLSTLADPDIVHSIRKKQ